MKEFDSSVLISYLAQKSKTDEVTISIREIRKIGHVVEERYPSIIIDMDKYSIESFRIKSRGHVNLLDQKIHFVRTDETVRVLLQENRPSDMLAALLEEVQKGED